jgi:D-aminopeptidase
MVTGDRATCAEAATLLGEGLTTVEVKTGLGRFSARSKTAQTARELIEDGARRALKDLKAVPPYDPGRPSEIRIEFTTPDRLVEYRNRRGIEQANDLTLVSVAADWWSAWSQFFF